MSTIKTLWRWLCPAWAFHLSFGGDSASTTTTENADMRVVGGENSQNVSVRAGGNVTLTDQGAVVNSLALAAKGIEAVQATAALSSETTGSMLSGVLKSTERQQVAFTDALKNIETKDTGTIILAALGVLGLAAVAYFQKAR